ncbi:MAG: outer membrane protein transport protein [Planctomycetes bacterium]|jgi:long-chain fatty acid transport protein|nr:outer membrane protein transport protein [Planctomycetota bacterium]
MVTAVAVLAALAPRPASAGGASLYEIGSPDTGLAGAGYAARAQDASTLFTNPAGMTRLSRSQSLFGIQPMYGDFDFHADRNNTVAGGGGGNASGFILSGSNFFVHSLSPDFKIGFGALSYFGSGLDYDSGWVGRYYVQDINVMGLTLMPAAAYRICEQFSVGAGLNIMYGTLSQDIAVNNVADSLGDGRITIEDDTWGFGGNFGVLFEASPTTRFGLTYLTQVDLDFDDSPEFRKIGPGLESVIEQRGFRSISLDMTVPQSLMASVYHELDDQIALLGNLGWQDWSRFGMVGVGIQSNDPKSLTWDRDYRDTFHFAVGLQYRPAPEWTLSCGVAYDTSFVKDRDRTVDFPGGATLRIGLGAQYEVNDNLTLGLAYELADSGSLSVEQSRGDLGGRVSGEYDYVLVHVFTISIIWKL